MAKNSSNHTKKSVKPKSVPKSETSIASSGKTVVIDKETGGRKEQELARFDLIPPKPLWLLAEHYGRGSKKYEDRNWEKGYNWSLSYDSLNHHLNRFWQGEDYDPENGALHIVAAAWHAFALCEFFFTHPEKDNRPYARSDDTP